MWASFLKGLIYQGSVCIWVSFVWQYRYMLQTRLCVINENGMSLQWEMGVFCANIFCNDDYILFCWRWVMMKWEEIWVFFTSCSLSIHRPALSFQRQHNIVKCDGDEILQAENVFGFQQIMSIVDANWACFDTEVPLLHIDMCHSYVSLAPVAAMVEHFF